ncbi:MAG TPA: ABC transporter ATP-binding protein [Bacteroidales bacterium]|nr:ABC transporter ATP-binding protein [Bacteroidales bacterium]
MEISVKELSKKYKGNKFGLKNFNLELNNGILGLIGPNGAGKSTLMRILATISQPSEGHVSLNGIDIVKFPDTVRKVLGYLPQDFGVYPNLTAIEFLQYIAAIKGFTGRSVRIRIEGLLEELNLISVRNSPIGTYSGGMKQRIGIAQVLIGDPRLLILDEPTVGLDPEERVRFRNMLTDLSGERIVILSSHIVSDIETIANDIAIVYQGRVLEHQSPDALLKTVEKQVYETTLTIDEFDSFRTKYTVSNSMRKNGGWLVRFVLNSGDSLPDIQVQPSKGTIEDAYLRIIASAKNGGSHED